MIEYRFAVPEDLPALTDFINLVFSMLYRPHDFRVLLPKVYDEKFNQSHIHAIAVENGRIIGCVGVYGFPLRVAGETLKMGYLGSVSVHQSARGKGVMKRLMQMQLEHAKNEKWDMIALGGQRQRYEYYGFTPCECTCAYAVNTSNLRHALADVDVSGIAFRRMTEDDPALSCLFALYENQPVSGARTMDNFYATLCSYGNVPWVILNHDHPVGYLVAAADSSRIAELVLEDSELIAPVVKRFLLDSKLRSLKVEAAPNDVELNRALARFCEGSSFSISDNGMLLCLNAPRVIRAFMKLRQQNWPLTDGVFRLGFGEEGTIRICVQNGEISVALTDETPDLALGLIDAQQLVFSCNRFGVAALPAHVPHDWFPLHFYIPEPDWF